MSQTELAERIGVHRSAVSHWEANSSRNPSISSLRRIAEVTGIHFEWLATGRGAMLLSNEVLLDAVVAADGLFIDESLEIRLIVALRKAPVTARIALVEVAEHLAAQCHAGKNSPRR